MPAVGSVEVDTLKESARRADSGGGDLVKSEHKEEDESKRTTIVGARKNDGTLEVFFSENDLEARADLYPPIGDGQALTPDYIVSILERLGIVHGVNWETVQEAALECNLNRKLIRGVLVARGEEPEEEVHEYFETEIGFREWPPATEDELPRIDFREISPFIIVKKDQVLARLMARRKGREGVDVHGNPIPMPIRRPESATSGPNTRQTADAIVAACDGRLIEKGHELSVEETLAIQGSVGYKTGHIVFPGDVVIEGTVADGFKVYAGGSIVSKQTVDATDMIAKKDLIVAGGIIGRGRASIRVGGTIRAKFAQNCRIACRGSVFISSAVINSQVYTMQRLDLGDKGKLIGGEVFAVHGLHSAGIGSGGGISTKIHCGIDFTAQQELDRANERMRVLVLKLGKLRDIRNAVSGGDQELRLAELIAKMEEEIMKLSTLSGELLGKLDADEDATVEVTGDIASGTLIEICHVALFVDESLRKQRFRLDKTQGRLIHEPL
jgi:uncharacterized protein (DUF342 family)